MKCSECGLLYVTPRPKEEEISKGHQTGLHQGESPLCVTGTFSKTKVKSYCKILEDLDQQQLRKGQHTWLDIGCGHGEFMKALIEFSGGHVIARGLEPNVMKQKQACKRGLDVSYFSLDRHMQQYDFVSLLNVYSHLPNPPDFFMTCRKVLKPGGCLLLETGDTANLSIKESPRPFCLPDHLSFASEEIISNILRRCGFEIVAVRKYAAQTFGYVRVIKELIKLVLPKKKSQLFDLTNQFKLCRKYTTDMYILATMKS